MVSPKRRRTAAVEEPIASTHAPDSYSSYNNNTAYPQPSSSSPYRPHDQTITQEIPIDPALGGSTTTNHRNEVPYYSNNNVDQHNAQQLRYPSQGPPEDLCQTTSTSEFSDPSSPKSPSQTHEHSVIVAGIDRAFSSTSDHLYLGHPSRSDSPATLHNIQPPARKVYTQSPAVMATAQMQRPSYPPLHYAGQNTNQGMMRSPHTQDMQSNRFYNQQSPMSNTYSYGSYSPISSNNYFSNSMQSMNGHPSIPPISHSAPPVPHQRSHSSLSGLHTNSRSSYDTVGPSKDELHRRASSTFSMSSQVQSNTNTQQTSPSVNNGSKDAAPGPIPATTPLVVRQDNNGTQWIAFEYSRDRVKMEYTIRCDVESVDTANLDPQFKAENCVYPRACCPKDQYRGNRLGYETECNNLGWALSDLNPCLRGKRGLIQRAVDSWRNSNQDPKVRSRRVRRQAKMTRRNSFAATGVGMSSLGSNSLGLGLGLNMHSQHPGLSRAASSGNGIGPSLHHHHATADSIAEEPVGVPSTARHAHVFRDFPSYPISNSNGPSMPPLSTEHSMNSGQSLYHDAIPASATSANSDSKLSESLETSLFGDLAVDKRRKFILVDDPSRGSRVRIRVTLDQVDMKEIPDSYRKANSVFPRCYAPVQMQPLPGARRGNRFVDLDVADSGFELNDTLDNSNNKDRTCVGRTLVPVSLPSMDTHESSGQHDDTFEIAVPMLSAKRHKTEELLNDLGYRMSWAQSRVLAGRVVFLQKSLDVYRQKISSSIVSNAQAVPGQENVIPEVPSHFETRPGKRRWLERAKRNEPLVVEES